MPIVTDIKRLKRSDDRFSVFVDGKYAFALPDLDLSISGLKVGSELSENEIESYCQEADAAKAYASGLRFLSYRPRSIKEMREYLGRKGYTDTADGVVSRMERAGLLDDAKFVESWIANRQMLRPRSRRRLEQELLAKGVAKEDIAAGLAGLEDESELEMLVGVAERKSRLPQYRDREKLVGYLLRQGYGYDQIKKALECLDESL